jgi:hypothetical protein
MKIFIDTNIFLDFYNSNEDKVEILKSLKGYHKHIVFPEQVFIEYRRNRVALLNNLIEDFKKNFKYPNFPAYPIVREMPDFITLNDLKKQYNGAFNNLIKAFEEMKLDTGKDIVFSEIQSIFESSEIHKIYSTDDIIERARKRQILGNPPRNTKKVNVFSACDEAIWETILSYVNDDLIIVSRDATYRDNFDLLRSEYVAKVGKELIKITDTINEAIKLIGETISEKIIELEEQQLKEIAENKILCDYVGEFNNKGERFCHNCKSYSKFIGVRCGNCGCHNDD